MICIALSSGPEAAKRNTQRTAKHRKDTATLVARIFALFGGGRGGVAAGLLVVASIASERVLGRVH